LLLLWLLLLLLTCLGCRLALGYCGKGPISELSVWRSTCIVVKSSSRQRSLVWRLWLVVVVVLLLLLGYPQNQCLEL